MHPGNGGGDWVKEVFGEQDPDLNTNEDILSQRKLHYLHHLLGLPFNL